MKKQGDVTVKELIGQGLVKGYLTFDEIYAYIEKHHLSESEAESVFNACSENGIALREENIDDELLDDDDDVSIDNRSPYESSLKIYMEEAKKIKILPRDEQIKLLRIYRADDGKRSERAREELIKTNLPLVIAIAKKYRGLGLSFEDLIQEGNIGLMIGLSKFDITKDVAVSTYITFWIRQKISRAIADTGSNIRVPVMARAVMDRIRKFSNQFEVDKHRLPSYGEIAEELGMSEEKVQEYVMRANLTNVASLDTPVGEDEELSLIDMISDPNTESPAVNALSTALSDSIQEILGNMSDRDRLIIQLRFGLNGHEPMTLDQIGKILNLTRERVRQIEVKVLRRMRSPKYARLLDGFIHND